MIGVEYQRNITVSHMLSMMQWEYLVISVSQEKGAVKE
jgi:hypothetical protein